MLIFRWRLSVIGVMQICLSLMVERKMQGSYMVSPLSVELKLS